MSVFGSSRTAVERSRPTTARAVVARGAGREGFAVITGGGDGVDGGRQPRRAGGRRSLDRPRTSNCLEQQALNAYVDLGLEFHYFFVRKLMFVRYACAFVVLPGGSARSTSCSRR